MGLLLGVFSAHCSNPTDRSEHTNDPGPDAFASQPAEPSSSADSLGPVQPPRPQDPPQPETPWKPEEILGFRPTDLPITRKGTCTPAGPPYSDTVRELTFRNSTQIRLEGTLANEIDCALSLIGKLFPAFDDPFARPRWSHDELVLEFPNEFFEPGTEEKEKRKAVWTALQVFSKEYPLKSIYRLTQNLPYLVLWFEEPLNLPYLAKKVKEATGARSVTLNVVGGDSSDTYLLRKNNRYHVVYKSGSGDCPAGCINEDYFYFLLNEAASEVVFLEARGPTITTLFNLPEPPIGKIPLWNIPESYSVRAYSSAEEIFEKAGSSPDWWARRHAVEVMGKLLRIDDPTSGSDYDDWPGSDRSTYDRLRDETRARRNEGMAILEAAKSDMDADVMRSSEDWLKKLTTCVILGGDKLVFAWDSGRCKGKRESRFQIRTDGCAAIYVAERSGYYTPTASAIVSATDVQSLVGAVENIGPRAEKELSCVCDGCSQRSVAYDPNGFTPGTFESGTYRPNESKIRSIRQFCAYGPKREQNVPMTPAQLALENTVSALFAKYAEPIDMCGQPNK